MMKILSNKVYLEGQLRIIRIIKDSAIQCHLDEFDFILIDLENVDVKTEDANKAILFAHIL